MAEEPTVGRKRPASLPICAVFSLEEVVSTEQRLAVVGRVLNEFSRLPVGVRNNLRSAVNNEVIPTTGGFRKGQAGRALERSSFLLQEPVTQAILSSDVLAGAVLQCWAESQPSLKEAVERHLTGRGLTTPGPDLPAREFRGYWSTDQWEVERESFAQIYDEDFDRRDVGLMLCYVSGNLAFPPDQSAAQEGGGTLFDAMSAALSKLRELPANAPEWERQIPDFVASVSRLIEEKAAQLRWAEEFDSIVRETRVTYGALLAFFEQDTEKWAAARVSSDADSDSVLKLARKLPSHLAEYLPVHERARSFSEERDRAQSREALQPAILALLLEISGLMTAEIEERDDHRASADAAGLSYGSGSPPTRPDAPEPKSQASVPPEAPVASEPELSAAPVLQEAHGPVRSVHPDSDSDAHGEVASSTVVPADNLAVLHTENLGLRDDAHALRSENTGLKDEVEVLKTELFSSQEREDSWRLAYRSAVDGSREDVGVAPPLVESVQDAVEMAKSRFRQELLFAPNAESNIEDNPFNDPARVWEALQWLANTYYPSKMGRLRVTDFDQSIKEACGWWYKGDQGETTVSRYKDSYTTRVDSRRYTLVEHIGKGTTFDARYTIRIAFDWDRDRRQVIVGYIGRHQQTDASCWVVNPVLYSVLSLWEVWPYEMRDHTTSTIRVRLFPERPIPKQYNVMLGESGAPVRFVVPQPYDSREFSSRTQR